MKIKEMVLGILSSDEKLQDIPENRAVKLVQTALAEILREIEDTDEGRVNIQGLGVFIVKQIEKDDGEGAKSAQKRIAFRSKAGPAKKTPRKRRKQSAE